MRAVQEVVVAVVPSVGPEKVLSLLAFLVQKLQILTLEELRAREAA
jgi:hypothetical protein